MNEARTTMRRDEKLLNLASDVEIESLVRDTMATIDWDYVLNHSNNRRVRQTISDAPNEKNLKQHEQQLDPVAVSFDENLNQSSLNKKSQQPKRPMNPFMLWTQAIRRKLAERYSNIRNAQLSKTLGRMWSEMDSEYRRPYVEEAERIRIVHRIEHPNYRYQPRRRRTRNVQAKQNVPHSLSPANNATLDDKTNGPLQSAVCFDSNGYEINHSSSHQTNKLSYGDHERPSELDCNGDQHLMTDCCWLMQAATAEAGTHWKNDEVDGYKQQQQHRLYDDQYHHINDHQCVHAPSSSSLWNNHNLTKCEGQQQYQQQEIQRQPILISDRCWHGQHHGHRASQSEHIQTEQDDEDDSLLRMAANKSVNGIDSAIFEYYDTTYDVDGPCNNRPVVQVSSYGGGQVGVSGQLQQTALSEPSVGLWKNEEYQYIGSRQEHQWSWSCK